MLFGSFWFHGVGYQTFFFFCGNNLCANPSGYIPVISCTRSLAAPSLLCDKGSSVSVLFIFFFRLKPGTIQYYLGLNYICSIQLHTHIYIIRLHAVVTQQFAMETQHVLTVFYKENHVNNRIKSAMFHSNVKLSEGT